MSPVSDVKSSPALGPLTVQSSRTLTVVGPVPRKPLADWVDELPDSAQIFCSGAQEGKAIFTACWEVP